MIWSSAWTSRWPVHESAADRAPRPGGHPSLAGTVGDAYDNGLMETINGLNKAECVGTTVFHASPYKTIADVEFATAAWVEGYNNRRLHGSLGNDPPAENEAAHYAALTEQFQPVWQRHRTWALHTPGDDERCASLARNQTEHQVQLIGDASLPGVRGRLAVTSQAGEQAQVRERRG